MSPLLPKAQPGRLPADNYNEMCQKVLRRDGWSCQRCGRRDQLEVHHLCHRSRGGPDSADNLIVLCHKCHRESHLARSR